MTRLIQEIFCYEEESVTGPLAADLMSREWLRFEPERFRADFFRKKGRYKPKEHIEVVRSADSIGWLNLSTDAQSFSVSGDGFGRYQDPSVREAAGLDLEGRVLGWGRMAGPLVARGR